LPRLNREDRAERAGPEEEVKIQVVERKEEEKKDPKKVLKVKNSEIKDLLTQSDMIRKQARVARKDKGVHISKDSGKD